VRKDPLESYCKERGPVLLELNQSSIDQLIRNKELENIEDLLSYISRLDDKNLVAILSLKHLSELLNINSTTLLAMSHSQESFYSSFYIPKRSGGLRRIDAPLPTMYLAQKFILDKIIKNLEYCSESATAYSEGCSIKEHVTKHINQEFVLKIDLKNFFPSISIDRVYKLLYETGYKSEVCSILANLLTLHGTLPQGAPSSPFISNVLALEMDTKVKRYCNKYNLIYSRYADDLAISGFNITDDIQTELEKIIAETGFFINKQKLKLYHPENRIRHLTGLVINKNKIRIPKSTRRKVRQLFFYVEKYLYIDIGIESAKSPVENTVFFPDPIVLERLVGYLNFWIWIEPNSTYAFETLEKIKNIKDSLARIA
jgi:RNA-directed DNA polymerase